MKPLSGENAPAPIKKRSEASRADMVKEGSDAASRSTSAASGPRPVLSPRPPRRGRGRAHGSGDAGIAVVGQQVVGDLPLPDVSADVGLGPAGKRVDLQKIKALVPGDGRTFRPCGERALSKP